MTDTRHPYTYAADFIRALGPVTREGVVLSRADASVIRTGIAKAIGMTDEELATKLSLAQQTKTQADLEAETQRLLVAFKAY